MTHGPAYKFLTHAQFFPSLHDKQHAGTHSTLRRWHSWRRVVRWRKRLDTRHVTCLSLSSQTELSAGLG